MTLVTHFGLLIALLFGLLWLGIVMFLRFKKKESLVYLLLFSIFYVYLYKVLDYTLFQFQSLLLLKHFMPNLMLRGTAPDQALNLIPLVTLTAADVKTSLLNILLFIPFGFGLPFITRIRGTKLVLIGALCSITIELLQLVTGLMAHLTFRVVDINDVLFNTVGVVIGYLVFLLLVQKHQAKVNDLIKR